MYSIQERVNLFPFHTFHCHVFSKYFIEVKQEEDLNSILSSKIFSENPYFIIGGGSNILFLHDYEGIILKISLMGITLITEDSDTVVIKVGAGVIWDNFVSFCVKKNYGGIENLSLIPGTVGASPIQNIGAYGVEIKECIERVYALDVILQKECSFSAEECQFDYRNSIFKNSLKGKKIITKVLFRLSKKPKINISYPDVQKKLKERGILYPTLLDIRKAIIHIRTEKLPDPHVLGNAGSFFKNPIISFSDFQRIQKQYPDIIGYKQSHSFVKIPAAFLIEKSGWKGKRIGMVGTYPKQPLVIVNYDNATGKEIWDFARMIQKSVFDLFGIQLEPEVNIHYKTII
ncbi:MAG: UDP-N-acetylmuramate dehydrogenase [Chitinophagaceae bacterium]|nr:UDP-N-acetylmuramate dehydrogenase [Chitinophagaceae bacterium]